MLLLDHVKVCPQDMPDIPAVTAAPAQGIAWKMNSTVETAPAQPVKKTLWPATTRSAMCCCSADSGASSSIASCTGKNCTVYRKEQKWSVVHNASCGVSGHFPDPAISFCMCLLPWLRALFNLAAAYTCIACLSLSLSAAHEPESLDHALFLYVLGACCCTCRRWEAGPDVAVAPRLPQLMLLMPDMLGPSMALAFLFSGATAPCAQ